MQIYLPILPTLQAEFGVSQDVIQLTFSLYILATGIAQLVSGTLSDRYGRRPVMLTGIVLFLVGSAACALAPNASALIVARIVQAAGGGIGLVVARAVLSDLYPPAEMAKRLATVILIMLIGPMLGPLTGGYFGIWFGWRSIFWLLTVMSALVLLLLVARLPETLPADKRGQTKSLRDGFALALGRPRFLLYAIVTTSSAAGFYLFLSMVPFVMENHFREPTERFGELFIVLAIAYGIGNFLATRYAAAIGIARTVATGSIGVVIAISVAVTLQLSIGLSATTLFAAMAMATLSQGFFNPSAQGGAVGQVPERAGTASSLTSFAMQVVSAALVQSLAMTQSNSIWPLLITLAVVHSIGMLAAIALHRNAAASLASTGRP